MASKFSTSFNVPASKVVRMSEWKQKTNALYQTELSTGERIYLTVVDKPLSLLLGLGIGLKAAFSGAGMPGVYINRQDSEAYVSGVFLEQLVDTCSRFTFNTRHQAKLNGLVVKAFEQSEDHSKKPIMQRLKEL